MLQQESRYDFYKRLFPLHRPDRRDRSLVPEADEFVLPDKLTISIDKNPAPVLLTAVKDFVDYLLVSMGISACLSYNDPAACIQVSVDSSVQGPIGYEHAISDDCIRVTGSAPDGAAQGMYALEDRMNLRCAPFLKKGVTARHALFDTRFVHSPFGMFEYPEESFSWMAHLGFNAIDLWLLDSGTSLRGDTVNVKLLCDRAERYGIKVYAELYQPHSAHPDDEGSQEFYDELYGNFFEKCPKLAGISLVGEANQFTSRDPFVGKSPHTANFEDNIPTGKVTPGWWPCEDYPRWVAMVRKSLDKIRPGIDIIFSTYNWGFAPEDVRVKLIENMPTDVTIVPTWDMFHQFKVGDVVEDVVDYTLAFAGPGEYFVSEAEACKRRGIRLGTNAQASGRTWDFGAVPYEPMPWAWIDRYEGMQKAHEKWGLCAVTECIHYGFWPSIISYIEKEAFFSGSMPLREYLDKLLDMEYGKENRETVKQALRYFDDAIRCYLPTNEDQYGAFRTGPSYPLWLSDPRLLPEEGRVPYNNNPMFKGIYYTYYKENTAGRNSLPGVRVHEELKAINKMMGLVDKGAALLEAIPEPNDELARLALLGRYIWHCCVTTANAKRFFQLKFKLSCCETRENAAKILDEIEQIMIAERKNAEDTIPIVAYDSRLGWEPSMEYVSDPINLRWKMRQIDYELTHTLVSCRKSNALGTPDEEKYKDAPIVLFH